MRSIFWILLLFSVLVPSSHAFGIQEEASGDDAAAVLLARLEGTDAAGKGKVLDDVLADGSNQILAVLSLVVDRTDSTGTPKEWQQQLNSDVTARQVISGLVMLAAAPGNEKNSAVLAGLLTQRLSEKSKEGIERFLTRMLGDLGNPIAVEALSASVRADEDWSDETVRSLGSIPGDDARGSLISLMLEAPSRWKPAIATALATREASTSLIGVLLTSLKDPDESIQIAALDALVSHGAEQAMKPAVDLLLQCDPEQKGMHAQRILELAHHLDENQHEVYARNLLDALLLTPGVPDKRRAVATRLRQRCGAWKSIFDGSSSDGWIGAVDGYQFSNGEIHCTAGTGGNIYTRDQYGDFILRFEFKLSPGANNGLGLRTPSTGDAAYSGMEAQILDDSAEKWADLKPYQYHGSIYGVVPSRRGFQKPVGEWNQQEVRCDGRHVKIVLNGHVIIDADLDAVIRGGTIDGREHPGLTNSSGHIGFLGHGDAVAFRNLRIRPIVHN